MAEYHKRIEAEDAVVASLSHEERNARLNEFLLPVGEEVGIFINSLAKSAKSKIILEIGTSYGYSTIWLAEAAKTTGGKVITLEISAEKAAYARQKIGEAELSEFVEFRVGDALESIAGATETFDFVLVDVWKELYLPCFDLFFPKLKTGAWVLADNMIFPPHSLPEATAYRNRVRETKAFDTILMPARLRTSFYPINQQQRTPPLDSVFSPNRPILWVFDPSNKTKTSPLSIPTE